MFIKKGKPWDISKFAKNANRFVAVKFIKIAG